MNFFKIYKSNIENYNSKMISMRLYINLNSINKRLRKIFKYVCLIKTSVN
jgi:hypothetical protein